MASATGIPDGRPSSDDRDDDAEEPLLGGPGDVTQGVDKPLYLNLISGTAVVAQAGIWILTGVVWGSVLSKDIILVSAHPLLNSAGVLLATLAILTLQPTTTASQKSRGTYLHSTLNNLGLLSLAAGLIVIEYNKISSNGAHFYSVHGVLGLVVYILFLIQALVGFTAFFTPGLYGSKARAKALYKWHRGSGYAVLVGLLATVCAAAETTFNKNVLGISLWAVLAASVITIVGVGARIKRSKLGL